jgi:hypothetical protein
MTVAHLWDKDGTLGESLVGEGECGHVEQIEAGSYAGRRDALADEPSGGLRIGNVEPPSPPVVNVEREAT